VVFGYDRLGNATCRITRSRSGRTWLWTYAYDSLGRRVEEHCVVRNARGDLIVEAGAMFDYTGADSGTVTSCVPGSGGCDPRASSTFKYHLAPAAAFPSIDLGGAFPDHTVIGDMTEDTLLPNDAPIPFL
jgi:YD repeat-containing protein